jgi:hypothetical protein
MDGEIWVESKVNNGSQFMFTIKTKVNPHGESAVLPLRMKPFMGRSVLNIGAPLQLGESETIKTLGLIPASVPGLHSLRGPKSTVPNADAIIVDSADIVSMHILFSALELMFPCLHAGRCTSKS